jgi:heme exporter protein D
VSVVAVVVVVVAVIIIEDRKTLDEVKKRKGRKPRQTYKARL